MDRDFSNTFSFESIDSNTPESKVKHIIYIANKNDQGYLAEYLQYSIENSDEHKTLLYRHKILNIDRLYFLEMANITINDNIRVEKFFTILGKRLFGSNEKTLEHYFLNPKLNVKKIIETFNTFKKKQTPPTFYFRSKDNRQNHYKLVSFKSDLGCFIFLDQNNISSRKSFKKLFLLELTLQEFSHFNQLHTEQKVEYCFSKLGDMSFRSLSPLTAPYHNEDDIKSLLTHSKIPTKESLKGEKNDFYEEIKNNVDLFKQSAFSLYSKTSIMIESINDESIQDFCESAISFIRLIKNIPSLEESNSYITAIVSFAQEGKLSYLLQKNDSDFYDIFLYTLEVFATWSNKLTQEYTQPKILQQHNKNLNKALKHLIETYLEFNHDYQIHDAKEGLLPQKNLTEINAPKKISANDFFEDIELDTEIIDELNELEEDIGNITTSMSLDISVCNALTFFYEGYASILNSFFEFQDLGYSLSLLSNKLKEYKVENKNKLLIPILLELVDDLVNWKNKVLIQQSAKSIHYMDSSFYAKIYQIEILIESEKEKIGI